MPLTDAQKRSTMNYRKHNIKTFTLQLNANTDADVICRLDDVSTAGESKAGYIKRLIREDMARSVNI